MKLTLSAVTSAAVLAATLALPASVMANEEGKGSGRVMAEAKGGLVADYAKINSQIVRLLTRMDNDPQFKRQLQRAIDAGDDAKAGELVRSIGVDAREVTVEAQRISITICWTGHICVTVKIGHA